jgi:sec-independent protein translocase protein TatA
MPTLGPLELAVILVIVIIIFGAGKLPELGSSLGKTFKDFRNATKEVDEIKQAISLEPTPAKRSEAIRPAAQTAQVASVQPPVSSDGPPDKPAAD